jgi:predicted transcriptional regulator
MSAPLQLSKRERQILEIVYRLGRATAGEIHEQMDDAPTYTTVRGLLRILERKGHIRHVEDGVRFVYSAVKPKTSAGATMLSHVVSTFFDGSPSSAVAALLGSHSRLSDDDLRRLEALIAERRRKGRRT